MPAVTSVQELLDLYQRGERDFSESFFEDDCDLSGVCLDGANFSRSFIVANFRKASLRASRFCDANLKTCDFRDADLRGANFRGAALCSALFDGANFDEADFSGVSIHGYRLNPGEIPF